VKIALFAGILFLGAQAVIILKLSGLKGQVSELKRRLDKDNIEN
jgi:hypothetical protein